MSYGVILALVLTLATTPTCVSAQSSTAGAANYPHIVVKLPEGSASESGAIWYLLRAQQGRTGPVKPRQNVRQYIIDTALEGRPARSATIYIYSPGCQFKVYHFELSDKSDVKQRFECV